jgi:hypothetical protein
LDFLTAVGMSRVWSLKMNRELISRIWLRELDEKVSSYSREDV